MFPTIPQHRINDSLLALVRAKHAIKLTQKVECHALARALGCLLSHLRAHQQGLIYRLDPLKYPAA